MERFSAESALTLRPLILIVDDQLENIQVLAPLLEMHGYSITYALNGQTALNRLKVIQPDLILLDLFMPDLDGLEVCQHIRTNPTYQDVPIIFITASDNDEHLMSAFEKGASDYVLKPFKVREILARTATHIQLRRKTIELKRSQTRLDIILTHMQDGILVIDQVGLIRFANPAAAHMFNKPISELLGYPLGMPFANRLAQIEILRLNGNMGIAEMTVAEAEWDDQASFIVCLRDISDRRDMD